MRTKTSHSDLTGDQVQKLWDEAMSHVIKGDYWAARLVIEKSLVSEVKTLELAIQRHSEDTANANRMQFKEER